MAKSTAIMQRPSAKIQYQTETTHFYIMIIDTPLHPSIRIDFIIFVTRVNRIIV